MICNDPDTAAARAFEWLAGAAARCPCCSFWRGVAIGGAVVAGVAIAVASIIIKAGT